jgi:hypothetical protein
LITSWSNCRASRSPNVSHLCATQSLWINRGPTLDLRPARSLLTLILKSGRRPRLEGSRPGWARLTLQVYRNIYNALSPTMREGGYRSRPDVRRGGGRMERREAQRTWRRASQACLARRARLGAGLATLSSKVRRAGGPIARACPRGASQAPGASRRSIPFSGKRKKGHRPTRGLQQCGR